MPKFSGKSNTVLLTCETPLQLLFLRVVKYHDCTIIEGHRSEERQNQLFAEGKTKAMYPDSAHNSLPSRAVDVLPYPINWMFEYDVKAALKSGDEKRYKEALHNIQRWAVFAGFVMGVAAMMQIPLRWGGDWDGDLDLADQDFDDWPHFELLKKEE